MGKRVLLTGGMGFIGHHLTLNLVKEGFSPIVFDNYSQDIKNDWHRHVVNDRYQKLSEAGVEVIVGDTRMMDSIQKAIVQVKPEKIVHLAATPSVVLSNLNPGSAIDHNLTATKNILESIRLNNLDLEQFIFFSSSTVYGDFKSDTVTEESDTNPKGIYEASKLSSELIIKAYKNLLGIPYTIIRPSALYGPGCINYRVSQLFVEKAILGETLSVENDGMEKLDFTYIKDLVKGVTLTLQKDKALNEIFNLTCGQGQPIIKLIDILREFIPDLEVKHIERDRMKPIRGTLDTTKAKNLLGYESDFGLDEGYREYINWYLNSPFKELAARSK